MTHILVTPTFTGAMICLFLMVSILGTFGALSLSYSEQLNDIMIRYDDKCLNKVVCSIELIPEVDLVNPKFYYRLENFYANHRNFVKSRSYKQLRGDDDNADESSCSPIYLNKNLDVPGLLSINRMNLSLTDVAQPCGLIARYFFNDTFKIFNATSLPTPATPVKPATPAVIMPPAVPTNTTRTPANISNSSSEENTTSMLNETMSNTSTPANTGF